MSLQSHLKTHTGPPHDIWNIKRLGGSDMQLPAFIGFLGQSCARGPSTSEPCWAGAGWRAPDSALLCKGKTGASASPRSRSPGSITHLHSWTNNSTFHFCNSNDRTCCINYSCGATEVALYRMGFHSQCHVSTWHTQTHTQSHHPLPVESQMARSDFHQTRLWCFLCKAHKCLFTHWLLKSLHHHPHAFPTTRSLRSEQQRRMKPFFLFPPGVRHATRLSITDHRVTGEDAAVIMESGCVDAAFGGGGTCEVALRLQSRGLSAAWCTECVYTILSLLFYSWKKMCSTDRKENSSTDVESSRLY